MLLEKIIQELAGLRAECGFIVPSIFGPAGGPVTSDPEGFIASKVINAKYQQFKNILGNPFSELRKTTNPVSHSVSYSRDFERGSVYWSANVPQLKCAKEVHGLIFEKYVSLGRENGVCLGLPISDEEDAPGGGRASHFEYGDLTAVGGSTTLNSGKCDPDGIPIMPPIFPGGGTIIPGGGSQPPLPPWYNECVSDLQGSGELGIATLAQARQACGEPVNKPVLDYIFMTCVPWYKSYGATADEAFNYCTCIPGGVAIVGLALSCEQATQPPFPRPARLQLADKDSFNNLEENFVLAVQTLNIYSSNTG